MRNAPWLVSLMLTAIMTAAACSGGSGGHGTVRGEFLTVGGPAAGVRMRLPGRVIATSENGRRFAVVVGAGGRFAIDLPAGTYQLTGYSPRVRTQNKEMRCAAPHPVRVRAGQGAHANVYCALR